MIARVPSDRSQVHAARRDRHRWVRHLIAVGVRRNVALLRVDVHGVRSRRTFGIEKLPSVPAVAQYMYP